MIKTVYHNVILFSLLVLLIITLIVSVNTGAINVSINEIVKIIFYKMGFYDHNGNYEYLIWEVRLPRVLTFAVGGILAISGTSLQALFRNPLAEPSIIGVSSGAALFAATTILFIKAISLKFSFYGISFLSVVTFIGALITSWFIFRISYVNKKSDVATMLLAGIAVNALCGALMGMIIFLSDDSQLRTITFWSMGSLAGVSWLQLSIMFGALIIMLFFIIPKAKAFNAYALGEMEAKLLGFDIEKLKKQIIVLVAFGVGVSVAFCGIIGFIGLVVPHIIRLIVGANHQLLLPASVLIGAIIMAFADTLSRTIVSPAELPIGIITSLAGSPIFIYLLIKQKQNVIC